MFRRILSSLLLSCAIVSAQTPSPIAIDDPVVALIHVRVIDGTGAPARADQTVIIDRGKIIAAGNTASTSVPANSRQLALSGYTVYPGLVGMHEHLFYPSGPGMPIYDEQAYSAPRLYLASGVTSMRTAGSLEPYTDINIKRLIEKGAIPGPKMDVTGPYIEGPNSFAAQMPAISSPEQARRLVEYWVAEGATSFKAYMNISHDALGAAIQQAHQHGIKVTGHLCSVGFTEAAELGIDNLEHGLVVDTEFTPNKQPNVCPPQTESRPTIEKLNLQSPRSQAMIHMLVQHHVAITSTLAVFEAFIPGRPPLQARMLDSMSTEAAKHYLTSKETASVRGGTTWSNLLRKEMDFEREFVAAGGLLIAGCDPTGNGGALPGFGDQRNIELLVEAGFTPEEAIRIYTLNGATYLGQQSSIGSIAAGKTADLVVTEGDPSSHIADVEKVKYVFKNGVGYESAKLIEAVRGMVGIH